MLLAGLLLLLSSPPTQAIPSNPALAPLESAIHWIHPATVPNSEADLVELATTGKMTEYSRTWIRSAIASAPSIDDCLARAEKEKKLLLWYIPAVEGQQMILPHLLDRYLTVGPFSHPDVTEIINRRFIALKLPSGGELAQRFQTAAPEFIEPGLLILSPQGEVLHRLNRINTFNSDYFEFVLTEVLSKHGKNIAKSPRREQARSEFEKSKLPSTALAYAKECLADGDYEFARDFLARQFINYDAVTADTEYWSAVIARRGRNAKKAIRHLDLALKLSPSPQLAAEIHAERGLVDLKLGDYADAEVQLNLAIQADSPRRLEATYLLGVVQYLTRREKDAIETWQTLEPHLQKSIWAAKAIAYARPGSDGAQGEGPLTRSMEDVRWSPRDAYRLRPDTQWERSTREARAIAKRATEFLLTQQRSNGSWTGPRWGGGPRAAKKPGNIEVAISALASAALLDWRKIAPEEIDAALTRADEFLLDDRHVSRDEIIWVYADAYRLLYFSKRFETLDRSTKKQVRSAMESWVQQLVAQQVKNNGPFSHYTYTSTFVTATATYCLHRARSVGIDVPNSVFETSANVLESCRGPQGFYGYLVDHPHVGRSGKGAAGRQPLCEWTLLLCGKSTPEKVSRALDVFFENYESSIELARKANFHIPALDNTAGYYFFHNFYPACEAAAASGRSKRKHEKRLLQLLCRLPEVDGTFMDAGFSYGKSYSTAMALLSLKVVQ